MQPPRTLSGLRPVIGSLVEYGAAAVELGEQKCPPTPPAALEHAQKIAWTRSSVCELHRAYLAARTVFNDFLSREANFAKGYGDDALAQVQRSNDVVFERLFHRVGEEFEQELERKRRSTGTQRLERVNALLAGELLEAPELDYDFDATHLGIVGSGEGLDACIKHAAKSVGGRLLLLQPSPQKFWAWVGTRSSFSFTQVSDVLAEGCPPCAHLSLGASAEGLAGWRRTHQQAELAFHIALRKPGAVVSYASVDLIAASASNPQFCSDLRQTYLEPLTKGRDGGRLLRKTLLAYFDAGQSATTAGGLLGIKRQTVASYLNKAEQLLGFSVRDRGVPPLHVALQLEELGFFWSNP